jgi:hypothetical protein
MGFASYVREQNDLKSRWRRAKEIVARHRNEDLAGPQPSIQDVAEEIRVRGPLEFARCRRLYFAIDLFPENDERYALRYEDVVADGQKPFDASPEAINN